MQEQGIVSYFLRQVPFDLPGGVRYLVDFMLAYQNGSIVYVDCKGYDTPLSIAKRKIVEDIYPVKIIIVKKI